MIRRSAVNDDDLVEMADLSGHGSRIDEALHEIIHHLVEVWPPLHTMSKGQDASRKALRWGPRRITVPDVECAAIELRSLSSCVCRRFGKRVRRRGEMEIVAPPVDGTFP